MAGTSRLRDLDARMAERRARSNPVRDLGQSDGAAGVSEKPLLSPLGWLIAALANVALVLVIGLGVVLLPPLLACREQGQRGFFAGDSFQTCASRGIAARFGELDGRLKRLILRSGQ